MRLEFQIFLGNLATQHVSDESEYRFRLDAEMTQKSVSPILPTLHLYTFCPHFIPRFLKNQSTVRFRVRTMGSSAQYLQPLQFSSRSLRQIFSKNTFFRFLPTNPQLFHTILNVVSQSGRPGRSRSVCDAHTSIPDSKSHL